MEDKTLFLYTAAYPYGKAESFLENEIPVLAKKFKRINIHPLLSHPGPIRKLPDNITTLPALNGRTGIDTSSLFIRNLFLILNILSVEFRNCNDKIFFLKNLRKFNSLVIRAVYDAEMIMKSVGTDSKNLIFYSYWMNDWALALAILKYQGKISKFVFRCGGFDIYDERHKGNYLPFRYFIYDKAGAIYPNSRNGETYIKKKKYHPEKVKLQYWGTKDHGLNPFDPKADITIVSCSNVIPLKRVHLLTEILMLVSVKVKWIHFGDGECLEDVKRSAEKLPENIRSEFRGRVPNTEVIEYYKLNSVNLFITTSETESLPVSIQEAMSFGIPVIATDVGGISEAVTEQTGYLISKDVNIQKVAEIINGFGKDHKNSVDFRNGVRNFWMEHFNAEITYNRFAHELLIPG